MANNLQRLRKERKLTLEDVGDKLFLTKSAVSKIENGNQKLSTDQAIILADLYGVSLDFLLGRAFTNSAEKTITIEQPPTYMNILAGLDELNKDQLGNVDSIAEYLLFKKYGVPMSRPFTNGKDEKRNEGKPKSQ